jgi:hypothetical protein
MRIIKEGQIPTEKLYEGTCGYCATVFEFKAGEATLVSDQRNGDCLTIGCPKCAKLVFVDKRIGK